MKKIGIAIIVLVPVFIILFFLKSCIIQNPQPEECEILEITVTEITEGSSYDIVFKDSGTDFYYINRGLEQGLTIADLKEKVLNKKVTLHLPKMLLGTSEHIAQLAIDEEVIFTKFD